MALTKISGEVIKSDISIGIVTANIINVGSAVTIHTRGFQVGTSDLHSTGLNLGSGNIISHNINSTGIITATQFATGTSGSAIGINTNTISGPATITIDPAAIGDNTGLVVIKGDLQIDGTTTTINSTTLTVDDKNIVLGSGAANDAAADGSGITIESGNGNKTFQFEDTGDNLGSSENLNVASGKVYKVNNTSVLSSTTLGSGVVNSSLTSVGTLTNLNVGNVNSSGIVTATTFVGALTGNAATVTTNANLTGDVTSTGNATSIAAGVIVNADINASAGIVDTKLATIATAGKVSNSATTATNANTASAIVARDSSGNFSAGTITGNTFSGSGASLTSIPNSATTATNANTASAIVARDASGNFSAGTITANLTGTASNVTTNANLTGDVTSTGNETAIAAGVIVNADINASAGIVDTKLATIATAGKVSNSATTATSANTINAIVARDGNGDFFGRYINSSYFNSTDDVSSGTITYLMGKFGDNYYRSATAAKVAAFISGQTMNISGTSASVANAATFNSGGAGAVSGTTFNGSAAQTISYNTIGASPLAGSSSLVTTGTVTSGTWSGSFGAVSGANLTSLTAGNLSGTIPSGVLGNSTHYVGTTAILLNRASASQSLTGINIDGSSGSVTGLTLNSSVSPINPDNVTQNQLGYNNSVSLFGQTDGGLYSSAYSSAWIHQIYGDFRTGQIAIRGKNSGTWQAWRTVLDSSNYTSYSPTLTGTGASGSWGINVTGSSASCTGNSATATTATNQSGGTVSATTGSFSSTLTVGGAIVRSAAGVGYLSGNYSSSESPSTSGAIYTIGGAYVPTSTTLGNMYGIGYGYAGNGGIGNPGGVGSSTWGMYVASNGTARIFLDSDNGISYATGSHRSPIFYDSGNTAYYTDPASTSNLNGLTVAATITGSISGNAATVTTNANLTGDVTSTGNATSIAAGVIVNADINASAGIVDTKLATIATAGKVSNSATTATSANTASAIVARDASGNFSAGWINTISGDLGVGSRLDRVYTSNDGYIRYLGLTDFKNQMGLSSKNTYSRRVDFTADANYWVGSFGHSGYGANETFHGGSGFFDIWGGTNYPSGLSHIHGINMLHYTTNSFGTTDGVAYGWQMVAQYDTNSGPWWRRCSGGTFSSWLRLVSYGNNQSGDIYAERYYDHNNTAYYVDPASTSNLNGLTVNSTFTVNNGWSYVANNYGYGIVGLYSASIFQLVFAMGDAYKTTAAGGINNLYGIAWSHPNAGGIAANLSTHGALITENGAFLAALSGSIRCRDDMRAPIFYDSNNTAYYIDPASTSNLNSLTLNGSLTVGSGASSDIYMTDTDEGTRRIHCNSNRIGFLNQDAGWGSYCSDNGDWTTDTISYAGASFRAPLYYDSGNTAYYTDPASTSNLNNVQVVTFGVGTAASGTAGEIRATNNITAYYSDERLKENIKPISSALSKLLTLRGVTFNSNEIAEKYGYTDKKEQVGVIAQDVEKILPQIVVPAPFDIAQDEDGNEYSKSGENYKTVHYDKLVPLLIEAIKEQQIQINYLKNIIINKSSN